MQLREFRPTIELIGQIEPVRRSLVSSEVEGLVEAVEILGGVDGIAFVNFTHRDVVRHRLVEKVVDRYSQWEAAHARELEDKP